MLAGYRKDDHIVIYGANPECLEGLPVAEGRGLKCASVQAA
jgi:hypothetical protein